MIARPRVLADEHAQFLDGAIPEIAGLDRIRAAVRAAGGREAVLERALASGAAAGGADGEPEHGRDLIAWAAWRAGVLGIRDDALARLEQAVAEERGAVAAAALGLRADTVAAFAVRQRADRFWWPDRADARGYVLAVGGFSGFGGAWIRPPEYAFAFGEGAFGIRVDGEWWRLDADAFGAVLHRPADPGALARRAASADPAAPATHRSPRTARSARRGGAHRRSGACTCTIPCWRPGRGAMSVPRPGSASRRRSSWTRSIWRSAA